MTQAMALEDSHESWLEDAVATLIGLAHVQEELTADDLRREMRPAPKTQTLNARPTERRTTMCSLQEHSARSYREEMARRQAE